MKIDRTLMKKIMQRRMQKNSQGDEISDQDMAGKKKRKRLQAEEKALFTGICSILLCCVMLAGSTMAWYTASVSTPVTSIKAGTLSVSVSPQPSTYSLSRDGKLPFVKHGKVNETGVLVGDETDIIIEEILWEPGDVYTLQPISVANDGTMDMKFQMFLSFTEEANNEENLELLQALQFKVTAVMPNNNIIENELSFPVNEFASMVTKIKDSQENVTGYEVKKPIFDSELFLKAVKEEEDENENVQPVTVTIKAVMPLGTGQKYAGKTLNNIKVIVNASQVIKDKSRTTDFTAVSNPEDLFHAVSNSGTIVLKNDIVLNNNEYLSIAENTEIVLDLQGFELKGQVANFLIENEGKLTVIGGKLNNTENNENKTGGIICSTKDEVTLKNVTLLNRDKTKALYGEKGAIFCGDFDLREYCVKDKYDCTIGNDSNEKYKITRKNESQ